MNPRGASADARPERFVWPPRPLQDQSPSGAAPADLPLPNRVPALHYPELALAGAGRPGRWRRAIRDIEAAWLGFRAAPLAERAAEAGWAPDGPDAYCPRCALSVGLNEVRPSNNPERAAGDCPACRRRNLPWERMVRLGEHADLLRDLVHEVKFTAWREVGTQVGRMLGRSLAAALDAAGVDRRQTVLVAMPTTYVRRMGRGIDHARVIARGVRDITGLPIIQALDRSHRRSQLAVPVSARVANVAGSMRAIPGVDLRGMTVILVDDVKTTGATMAAAGRALAECTGQKAGTETRSYSDRYIAQVRVWGAVVAVARQPGRREAGTGEKRAEVPGMA